MTDEVKYKASRYNHFVENNGKVLAFNAMSCGLGEMDKENYEVYQKIIDGKITDYTKIPPDLLEKLKQGNFLVPETRDEIQKLKAGHFAARFSNRGFGLTIIPTLECNFACDYCYEPSNPDPAKEPKRNFMSQEVQDGLVEMVKSMLPHGTMLGITWYGGEPLLGLKVIESQTEKFKRVCEDKNAKYTAGIVTNGYLLTPEVVNRLVELNVSLAQVTVDGPQEIHNKRRPLVGGSPTYEVIMHNLEEIPENVNFFVSIRVNIDKRNRDDVIPLLKQLKERGLCDRKNISLYFSQVHTDNYACKDIKESCFLTREYTAYELELYKQAIRIGFKVRNYPMLMIVGCSAITSHSFVVEPDGTLQACWDTVGRKELSIGKIENSILKLNDNYCKWLSYSPFEKKECLNCSVLPICLGGCPYRNIYEYRLSSQERNTCMIWKYNLRDKMRFYVEAHKMGLFVPPKRQQKVEKAETQEGR
ncbi:MAG: SPASM domain-containing protein [candidate division Zixibacteria bacterium]|nr:SPASM domain-containing protein [candidate division Zixibacteria bacterium]